MALGFSTLNHSTMFGCGIALADQVRAAADAGFDLVALDIFSLRQTIAEGRLDELVALIDRLGIEVLDICALAITEDDELWPSELAETVGAAAALRSRHVMVRFDAPIDAAAIARTRRAVAALAEVGVTVVVEPSPLSVVGSLARARELKADVGEGVGLVVDSWHFFAGSWWATELAAAAKDIAYVQIADGLHADGADMMAQTLHHRRQPGAGEFDVAAFVRALTAAGYRGPWCAEVLSEAQRGDPVAAFAARTHGCLAALCSDP